MTEFRRYGRQSMTRSDFEMAQRTPGGDALGARMKSYEFHETQRRFLPTLPVYARIDGRSFSRFTKGMNRPYDIRMTNAMIETTKHLVAETHALIGYVQSDEISLVWHVPDPKGSIFFDGKIMKMASVLSGIATSAFMRAVLTCEDVEFRRYAERLPHFDARVIQLPSRVEAANMVLWRTMDATKNAISMAAHHHFSHKSLQGMSGAQMQERLFQEAGVNFTDYPAFFRQGTFVRREAFERAFTEEELARIPEKHRPAPGTMVTRSEVRVIDMPIFSKVVNRVEVIFEGAAPRLAGQDEADDAAAFERFAA